MNRLDGILTTGNKNQTLFMAHMIAGYPSAPETMKVAQALVRGGVDIIELQIPFSDPMADGPTIAVACEEALQSGASVSGSLVLLKKISALGKPVAIMTYLNPVFRYGIEKFVATIERAGASALIVPDCPFDSAEGEALLRACKKHDVYLIPVVSPGVPKQRLVQIAKNARGFVYCTSRQGITGANSAFARSLLSFVKDLKDIFGLPIAVGFGVKSRKDVALLSKHADIVIAGSVFVEAVRSSKGDAESKSVERLAEEFIQNKRR